MNIDYARCFFGTAPYGVMYIFNIRRETKMAVQHIKEAEFDEVVLKSDVPVLVDFFAEWCGPCKMMEPILEQASEEVSGAKIVAVDADEAERLCIVYGISNIPCMILFKNGEEADRIVGRVPKQKIIDTLNA